MTTTYANETIGISGLVLPDAPEPNTYRIDGEEVTEDRFIEWFDNPGPEEFLEKVIKEGKDGEPDRIEWKLLPGDLADAVCNRFKPAKYNNVDYYFDRVSRIYRRDNGTVRAWIYATLRNAQRDDKLPKTYNADRDVCTIARAAALSNVIESDTYPFNVYDGFPVNNGVIVFNKDGTFTVRNITSAMKFTRKAAVNYNPDRAAEKTQRAETILRQWLPEVIDGVQQWEWLVQIIAQAILQSLPDHDMFKASYILLGEADSGKTTAGDLNSLFFGRYNVSSKKLQQFGSRFDKGELVGKFVNYGDDIATIK
ncbi:MAG TPA: hypothetical protein O0X27_06150, partial [Methanocorpusculum sp.]|nr:hypothetical protein [Methanocorpusculum sp.]